MPAETDHAAALKPINPVLRIVAKCMKETPILVPALLLATGIPRVFVTANLILNRNAITIIQVISTKIITRRKNARARRLPHATTTEFAIMARRCRVALKIVKMFRFPAFRILPTDIPRNNMIAITDFVRTVVCLPPTAALKNASQKMESIAEMVSVTPWTKPRAIAQ